MKRDLRFSRRLLLKSMGAGAALLPMLQADRADAACYVGGIKRLYMFCWTNGMLSSINDWATAGNDPTSWSLGTMGFQDSLKPYMSDLLLLKGIDYKYIKDMPGSGERTGHACFPGMLTGAYYKLLSSGTSSDLGGGISVDQYIGTQLQQKQGYKGLVSLNQGAYVVSTGHLSWSAAGQVVLPNPDPASVFSLYFKGMLPAPPPPTTTGAGGKSGTMTPPPPVDNTAAIQKSILDYVISDINRFSNIVGTEDKQRIDQHLTSVRAIETRLQSMGGAPMGTDGGAPVSTTNGTPAACDVPSTAGEPTANLAASVPAITKLHMDLAIAAFGADLTRVVVMQVGDQGSANLVMNWLGFAKGGPLASDPNTGDTNGFHAIAHENTMRKVTCDTWFQSQLAYVIGQLKSISDGTGKSMLDSSVVVGMNSMRTGTHETTGVPVVMAGSCGGYFKTGRSLALPAGTPNNGLLVALCNAMGTPVSTFGEASYGGELTALKG
ncbi:MAG: DUF1552 domain-containing protein [Pseudomonadota bacterium]